MIQKKIRPLMPINSSLIKLYHGSPYPNIKKFEITARTRSRTDYGLGVYFTTNREQAKKWSVRGNDVTHGYVYETCLDYTLIQNGTVKLKQFLGYDDEFIDTFTECRTHGTDPTNIKGYDIIYGIMIDSNGTEIYNACDAFAKGKISREKLKIRLKALTGADQVCIKNNKLLKSLKIVKVEETCVIEGRSKAQGGNIIWKKK
uniref:DUF3990 domain-containing protein n=1 Tax=Siphoviridae sp. ct87j35 TaxID=2825356 RepID=A0A8S5V4E1_9CAUD|nr:MAG TPA: Protein of unknown function (DUF3990) [Siphoviridae sp. ct87j35]